MWGMAAMTLLALPMVGRLTRGYQPPPAPTRRRRVLRAIRTAMADRKASAAAPEFSPAAFALLLVTHLPGEGESVRPAAVGGQLVAGHYRPVEYCRQPVRRGVRVALPQQMFWR